MDKSLGNDYKEDFQQKVLGPIHVDLGITTAAPASLHQMWTRSALKVTLTALVIVWTTSTATFF